MRFIWRFAVLGVALSVFAVACGGGGESTKTVKLGETVSATGMIAKSGDPAMIASKMKLADGREIQS